jgi:hypothetical protein
MDNACSPAAILTVRRRTPHPHSPQRLTPESSAWLCRAEPASCGIQQTCLRPGSITSAREHRARIQESLAEQHQAPRGLDWTKRTAMAQATIEGCRGA